VFRSSIVLASSRNAIEENLAEYPERTVTYHQLICDSSLINRTSSIGFPFDLDEMAKRRQDFGLDCD